MNEDRVPNREVILGLLNPLQAGQESEKTAWHDRKVIGEKGDRAIRETVLFSRQDLLWQSAGIINPYKKKLGKLTCR